MKTLRNQLSIEDQQQLLLLVSRVQTETAKLVSGELFGESGHKRGDTKNYREMIIEPEKLIEGLSEEESGWIADIFAQFYIAKDIREMSGSEAFEFLKKYRKHANIVAYNTLMIRVYESPEGVNIKELLDFVQGVTLEGVNKKSIWIYNEYLGKIASLIK